MCGIVGYIGEQQAAPILLDGLSKLEYRGYDSAGIAVFDGKEIHMEKATGTFEGFGRSDKRRNDSFGNFRNWSYEVGDAWKSF